MVLNINTHKGPYRVSIEPGLLGQLREWIQGYLVQEGKLETELTKIALVTDDHVWSIYGENIKRQLQDWNNKVDIIPPGEGSKSHSELLRLYGSWSDFGLSRSDLVLAFGGGVIGDLAGYAAATFMRGIPFIQMPTTLLSQVDSSIGGKVAINLAQGKNLVGTFMTPRAVLIDPMALYSLPKAEWSQGMAEVIKAAAIGDKDLFGLLKLGLDLNKTEVLVDLIQRALGVKKHLVEQDEFEQGARMLLNFGHTLGHAIETYGSYTSFSHGQGVAMGMVAITEASEAMGLTVPGTTDALKSVLKQYDLPTQIDRQIQFEPMISHIGHDKKRRGNALNLVIVETIGNAYIHKIRTDQLSTFLKEKHDERHTT